MTCTVGRCCLRGMVSAAFGRPARLIIMTRRFTFVALCLATALPAVGQSVPPASPETPGPRPIARVEGRKILAAIPKIDAQSESETDCSHLVHDVYGQAGLPYDYVTSRELYIGSPHFTRVREPQPGDLVVWRGHVGIVVDPKQRSFFSFMRSGPDTQSYDSPYWRSRGVARFLRYVTEKPGTLEASGRGDHQPLLDDSRGSKKHPRVELSKPAPAGASGPVRVVDTSRSAAVGTPREIVLQAAGDNPSPEEVVTSFVELNQDSSEALRSRSLDSLGKPVIVYREIRILATRFKGKRGTAVLQIESLGAPSDTQTGSQFRWNEQSLEFQKTKRGWVMSPIRDAVYVKREVALRVLSARLAELAQNTNATPGQEREQQQIIRLLNLLVIETARQ